jgi:predicted Rossmann fold nucleotide-binding protein DprA/Smf involved in DNA uptake
MPEFVDLRVRVRKERLGDLVVAMATHFPYAQFVGFDVVREVTVVKDHKPLLLPPPAKDLTVPQQKVLAAVQKGAVDQASIAIHTKIGLKRMGHVIKNLTKKHLIKGSDGSYIAV